MRGLLDFLARWVEPYVSFRWLIALIFAGMLVSDLLGTWLWLREIGRTQPGDSRRERQLRRIARAAVGSMLLRLFSWRALFRQRGIVASIVLLAVLAIALNVAVYWAP